MAATGEKNTKGVKPAKSTQFDQNKRDFFRGSRGTFDKFKNFSVGKSFVGMRRGSK